MDNCNPMNKKKQIHFDLYYSLTSPYNFQIRQEPNIHYSPINYPKTYLIHPLTRSLKHSRIVAEYQKPL